MSPPPLPPWLKRTVALAVGGFESDGTFLVLDEHGQLLAATRAWTRDQEGVTLRALKSLSTEALTFAASSGKKLMYATPTEVLRLSVMRLLSEDRGDADAPGYLVFVSRRSLQRKSETELTEREIDVAELLAKGLASKEVARTLGLAVGTVNVHARNIYAKLGVNSRAELISKIHEADTEEGIELTTRWRP